MQWNEVWMESVVTFAKEQYFKLSAKQLVYDRYLRGIFMESYFYGHERTAIHTDL